MTQLKASATTQLRYYSIRKRMSDIRKKFIPISDIMSDSALPVRYRRFRYQAQFDITNHGYQTKCSTLSYLGKTVQFYTGFELCCPYGNMILQCFVKGDFLLQPQKMLHCSKFVEKCMHISTYINSGGQSYSSSVTKVRNQLLFVVLVVRYHCGGQPEEVNSCVLNSYMVYL